MSSAIFGFRPSVLLVFILCSLFSYAVLIENQNIWSEVEAQTDPTTTKLIPYDGSKYGIDIDYPSNWNITEDDDGVWFVSPVDQTVNIRIKSESIGNASLAKLVQAQLLISQNAHKELNIVSSNITVLDGNPANRTDYKFKEEIPKFLGADLLDYTSFQISAVKGDKLYTFIYFSTPDNFYLFLPIAQKMLSTLKIL
jgi:hypothetical protein